MHRQMAGYSFVVPAGDYDLLSDAGSEGELGDAAMSENPQVDEAGLATMADAVDNDLFELDL